MLPHDYDGSSPLLNRNHELFAMARGFEGLTVKGAYESTAGKTADKKRGGENTQRASGVKERVAYLRRLRESADMNRTIKSREEILLQVQQNADDAGTDKQYSASNAALKMLGGEVHGMFREKVELEQPGKALKEGSLKGLIEQIRTAGQELGMGSEIDGLIAAWLGRAAEEVIDGSARLVERVEVREDQSLQAESAPVGVSHAGSDVLGESDTRRQSTRKVRNGYQQDQLTERGDPVNRGPVPAPGELSGSVVGRDAGRDEDGEPGHQEGASGSVLPGDDERRDVV